MLSLGLSFLIKFKVLLLKMRRTDSRVVGGLEFLSFHSNNGMKEKPIILSALKSFVCREITDQVPCQKGKSTYHLVVIIARH